MIWHVIVSWTIAGCFSASALNLSGPVPGSTVSAHPEVPALQETITETPLKPASTTLAPSSSSTQGLPGLILSEKNGSGEEARGAGEKTTAVEEYRIQPEDILQITVFEEPDLTTKARVATNGEIHFPLVGSLYVAGLSVTKLQEQLTRLLAQDYLVNPQVQVFIESYHAREVFVTGSVNKPGAYPLPAGKVTTLMEAITLAGGFHERAAVNKTRIIRIENGQEKTINVKANDIIKKGDKSKDVEVRPNDVIFVPESFF